MDDPTSVKTVDRLVEILDCFTPDRPTWSLTELSEHLHLPKSTVHRFVTALEARGILRRSLDDKRFALGYKLWVWGNLAGESMDLRHIAQPIMRDLVAQTGETVILTIYQDREVVCLDKLESEHPVRMTLEVGRRRPPHAGASCKILMAYLPEEEIQAIIREKGLPKLCTNTITDPDELLAELARIREQGYAESCEETDLSARGVATPIYDQSGQVIAAIGIAGPVSRFTEALVPRYAALAREAAQKISALLMAPHAKASGESASSLKTA